MSHAQIEQFLEQLSAAWPRDAERAAALDELRDHLLSVVEDETGAGESEQEALERALAECGPPVQLARQYRGAFYERRKRWIMRLTTASLAAAVLLAIGVTVWWPGKNGSPIVAQAQAQAPEGATTGGAPTGQLAQQQPSVEENNAITQRKLAKGVKDCSFQEVPLTDVFNRFREQYGVQFYVNKAAVTDAGINVGEVQVTLNLADVRLETALDLALQQAGGVLDYYLRDGVIMITTKESMENASEVRAYPVADLLKMHTPSPRPAGGTGFGGGGGFFGAVETPATQSATEGPAAAAEEHFVQFGGGGAAGGNPATGQPATAAGGAAMGGVGLPTAGWHTSTAEDDLINVIQKSVAPDSWVDGGNGEGTITYFGGMLIIRQSARTHREVEKVLSLLRETAQSMPRAAAATDGGGLDAGEDLKVFTLQHARAKEAETMVTALMQDERKANLRVSVDERTNTLIVRGNAKSLAVIEAILLRLDQKKVDGTRASAPVGEEFIVFYLKFVRAKAAASNLKERFPKAKIIPDERLNAIYLRQDAAINSKEFAAVVTNLDQSSPAEVGDPFASPPTAKPAPAPTDDPFGAPPPLAPSPATPKPTPANDDPFGAAK